MRKYLLMFFLMIIILCLPIVSNAAKLMCQGVAVNDDDYEIPVGLTSVGFNADDVKAALRAGAQSGDLPFIDAYEFFTEKVDIDKLNKAQKKEYVNIINAVIEELEDKEGVYARIGGSDTLKDVKDKYGQKGEKDRIKKLIEKAGGNEQAVAQAQTNLQDAQNNQDVSHSTDSQQVTDTIAEGNKNNHREPKIKYTFGSADKDKEGVQTKNIGEIINDAKKIEEGKGGDVFEEGDIKPIADFLYNTVLAIGVAASVIVGGIIGIKLMTGSAEQKAETKQYIVPYIVGCVVIFGGLGIWKLVVEILKNAV